MNRIQFISNSLKLFCLSLLGEPLHSNRSIVTTDRFTKETVKFTQIFHYIDGSLMDLGKCDGVIYLHDADNFYKREFDGTVNMKWFGVGVLDNVKKAVTDALVVIEREYNNIYFPKQHYNIQEDIILPPNISVEVEPGARFEISAGKRLVIQGSFRSAFESIFYGPGNVSFTSFKTKISPEWWNCEDLDESKIINKAIEAAPKEGQVNLNSRSYNCYSTVLVKDDITLEGKGIGQTILVQKGEVWDLIHYSLVSHLGHRDPDIGIKNVRIRNLSIINNYGNDFKNRILGGAIGGVYLGYAENSIIENIEVSNGWTGIAIQGYSTKLKNRIRNCKTNYCIHNQDNGNPGVPRGIYAGSKSIEVDNCSDFMSYGGFYCAGDYGKWSNCKATLWQGDNGWYVNADYNQINFCTAIGGTNNNNGFGSGFAINSSKGTSIENCIARFCGNMGVRLRVLKGISSLSIKKCKVYNCGIGIGVDTTSATPYDKLSKSVIQDNQVEFSNFQGILISHAESCSIKGNFLRNNNQKGISSSTRGAIALIAYVINNVFRDNIIIDDQTAKTQKFGFYNYSKNDTRSKVENQNNKIYHSKSKGAVYGDYFGAEKNIYR